LPETNEPREPELELDIRANRYDVLSRLADDLAHEIKNPLNAIVVNLEVLRRRVQSSAAEKALERADVIEHEVRRVHALVDQLLQLLRPPKGETGPIAIDAVVQSLVSAIQLQAKAAQVDLSCDAESSLYAQVRAEPMKFALLNLLTYAIDEEARAGGAIRLNVRRVDGTIRVVVHCARAVLARDHEHMKYCARLMTAAGGELAAVEPREDAAGSIATLVMPSSRFM